MPAAGALTGLEDIEPCGSGGRRGRAVAREHLGEGRVGLDARVHQAVARAQDELLAAQAAWPGSGASHTLTAVTWETRQPGGLLHGGGQRLRAGCLGAHAGLVMHGAEPQRLAEVQARWLRLGSRGRAEEQCRHQHPDAHADMPLTQPHTVVIGSH